MSLLETRQKIARASDAERRFQASGPETEYAQNAKVPAHGEMDP